VQSLGSKPLLSFVHDVHRKNVNTEDGQAVIALMMEAARTSETLADFYQTTRRYNPEDSHLRTHRRENLKSYNVNTGWERDRTSWSGGSNSFLEGPGFESRLLAILTDDFLSCPQCLSRQMLG
jgi:hypothetical protein